MKKGCRLISIFIMVMMINAPFMSIAMAEDSLGATDNGNEATVVTVVDSAEKLTEESEAAYDNDAFFTIDMAKDDSADLVTDAVREEVTDILSGGGSDSEKQSEIIDTLDDSGLYRAEEAGASKVDVTSKFAYQRLRLIAPQEAELNAYGATKAVYFEDSYFLSYDSIEATMKAYDSLASEYGDDAVFIDTPMKLCADEKGWGTSFMRLDHQKTLDTNSGQVTVAVVDSGIQRSHPIFSGTTILEGLDFVNKDNDPADDDGHGTAVSGIIAESTPSNVKILPLKAMDAKGEGSEFDVLAAIRYAEEQGADIINLSLGGYLDNLTMEKYDEEFSSYNALIVCAAGNENKNMDDPGVCEFPGELSSAICVGAITSGKERWYSSNYGQALDFAAPGSSVAIAKADGSYQTASGTSFSSPYIAAAAAIVKAGHEEYSNEQIISHLESIAEDMGTPGRDVYYGRGCPRFPAAPWETDGITTLSDKKRNKPAVSLSASAYIYTGKAIKPALTVMDGNKKLTAGKDYKVAYSDNVNVGVGQVKVTCLGGYSGTRTVSFKIIPKGTEITLRTPAAKALTVRWKPQSAKMKTGYISGYQVQVSNDKTFRSNVRTITVKGHRRTTKTVSGLRKNKKYYVRVRTYMITGGKTYRSRWSAFRAARAK